MSVTLGVIGSETIGLGHLKFSVIQFEVFTDTLHEG